MCKTFLYGIQDYKSCSVALPFRTHTAKDRQKAIYIYGHAFTRMMDTMTGVKLIEKTYMREINNKPVHILLHALQLHCLVRHASEIGEVQKCFV